MGTNYSNASFDSGIVVESKDGDQWYKIRVVTRDYADRNSVYDQKSLASLVRLTVDGWARTMRAYHNGDSDMLTDEGEIDTRAPLDMLQNSQHSEAMDGSEPLVTVFNVTGDITLTFHSNSSPNNCLMLLSVSQWARGDVSNKFKTTQSNTSPPVQAQPQTQAQSSGGGKEYEQKYDSDGVAEYNYSKQYPDDTKVYQTFKSIEVRQAKNGSKYFAFTPVWGNKASSPFNIFINSETIKKLGYPLNEIQATPGNVREGRWKIVGYLKNKDNGYVSVNPVSILPVDEKGETDLNDIPF